LPKVNAIQLSLKQRFINWLIGETVEELQEIIEELEDKIITLELSVEELQEIIEELEDKIITLELSVEELELKSN
jgi:chromosome segregation ATPase